MNIDDLRIELMKKATFVTWPPWSGGNALGRIISAHQEDYWWHPYFNFWDYDEKITCPLQYPENQDYQETLNSQFWTTAHVAQPFPQFSEYSKKGMQWDTVDEINQSILDFRNEPNTSVVTSFFKEVIKGDKKFVWLLSHTSANIILKRYPHLQQIVELDNTNDIIGTRLGIDAEYLIHIRHFKENKDLSNKKILYMNTDNFFGEDFLEYEKEFDKLSNFLKFTYPRKKAVRTYLLYYNDRKKTYGHIDKQSKRLTKIRENIEKRKNERVL